jgi:hypothetical protein
MNSRRNETKSDSIAFCDPHEIANMMTGGRTDGRGSIVSEKQAVTATAMAMETRGQSGIWMSRPSFILS